MGNLCPLESCKLLDIGAQDEVSGKHLLCDT